jgi:Suppressor of fused protein (SUFU)
VTQVLTEVRAHLRGHFAYLSDASDAGATTEPDSASVTFLGVERIEVLRFGPDKSGVYHYVSLGCSRHPMGDPTALAADPLLGPRAEIVVSLRDTIPTKGLARTVALLAATPAVDGMVLMPDALIDLGSALWSPSPFTAVLLGESPVPPLHLDAPREPVIFLSATPISANEAAWVRLKGVAAMREAWQSDGVDILDPQRRAAQPR